MKTKLLSAILTALLAITPVALAVDLGDYPGFLFDDHNLDAYVVVGSAAAPGDVVGAVDLAARLAGESYELVSSGGSTVTVTGGKSEEIPIGVAVGASGYLDTTFTDDDLTGLQDDAVTFQSDSYNFHDEVVLSATTPVVHSSLSAADDDYSTGIYMEVGTGALSYYLVFDEAINISTASSSQPLKVNFMGKTIKITSVSSATSFTAYVGDTYSMNVGDSVTVEGKTVTLENVGSSGSVKLSVDGTSHTVSGTETVDGIEVTVDDYFYSDTTAERAATLVMGKQAIETYSSGNRYKKDDGVCNDDPDDTDCWLWSINGLTANAAGDTDATSATNPTIGITSDFSIQDDAYNPITEGGCYTYPNDYAQICFDAITVPEDKYSTITFKYQDGVTLGAATNQNTIRVTSSESDGLQVEGDNLSVLAGTDKRTNKMWFTYNTTSPAGVAVWYLASDGTKTYAGTIANATTSNTTARVYYGDTKDTNVEIDLTVSNYGFDPEVNVTLDIVGKSTTDLAATTDDLTMVWELASNAFNRLGDTQGTNEAGEIFWCNGDGSTCSWRDISTKDEDHRSRYGIIVLDPKSHGASDEVSVKVPNEQVYATISVKSTGTTTVAGGDAVKQVVPVTNAVAKLDTEVNTPVGKHLVLVGGPAVNRHTAAALGLDYPTYGGSGLLPFAEGEGYVEVVDGVLESGKYAVVVAGWEAANTRDATSVMQQFDSFMSQLDGNMAVKVTSVSASGITAAV
jgi:hypothetical protein